MQYTRQQGDELLVLKHVPYAQQVKKMSCWFACAQMLFNYRRPNADFRELLEKSEAGRALLARHDSGLSIETDEKSLEGNLERWAELTEAFGMRQLWPVPRTAAALAAAIEEYGPLWCAGLFFQGSASRIGHIVVALGVFKRNAPLRGLTSYVIFHDPAPPKFKGEANCIAQLDGWFAKRLYNEHETNGESPVMYLPESAVTLPRQPQTYSGLGVGTRENIYA